jgi:hypothetical protein
MGPPEPPELDGGGEGDEMQPFMQQRGAEKLAETAIGPVENDQAEIGGVAQASELAPDLAHPGIEERAVVVHPRHAAWLVRQHRLDDRPFVVGEFVSHDSRPLQDGG